MLKLALLALATGLALTAGTGDAQAGVIDDVRRGDCIYFDSFRFVNRGELRGTNDLCLRKAPGSLGATISLRDLGVDPGAGREVYIPLTPLPMPVGTTMVWTFDQPIVPGIQVEIGHWVDHVRGAIAIDFAAHPAAPMRVCNGAVERYSLSGRAGAGTWLDVHVSNFIGGRWWEPSSNFDITAVAGVGPATLANLELSTTRVCAGAAPRIVTGTVTLDAPSSALGTQVDVITSDEATLRAAGALMLGPDQRTAAVRVRVEGAAIGTHTITARGGGGAVSRSLRVADCSLPPNFFLPRFVELWRDCALCDTVYVNARGMMAATLAGTGVIVDDHGLTPIAKITGVDAVPRGIDDLGRVVAVTQDGKGTFIIGPERDDGDREIVLHEGFEALGLGDQGLVVGRDHGDRAMVSGPYGQVVLPIDAVSARAVATNALGWVVGTYVTKDGVERAFVHDGEKLRPVPVQGKGSRALAVSDAGQVVGTARDATGRWRAFSYTPEQGVVDLGFGDHKHSEAIAVDALGNAIVAADDGQRRQTFLVLANGKHMSAKELSSQGAEVGDLVGFSRAGSLIARGVFQGEGGLFELVPAYDDKQ